MIILLYILTAYTGPIPISPELAYNVLYEMLAEVGMLYAYITYVTLRACVGISVREAWNFIYPLLLVVLCFSVVLGAIIFASACSPLAPDYTCTTQPRGYYNPASGISTMEVDTYTQSVPCPRVPIA